jgi:hypothetical protein
MTGKNIKLIFIILKEIILLIKLLNDEWDKEESTEKTP